MRARIAICGLRSRDSLGHVRVYRRGLGDSFLPCRNETCRLPELLRDEIRRCGTGQHVLPHACDFNCEGLVCENSAWIFVCGKGAANHHARESLVDCDEDFREFLKAMDCLGEKLGPLLLQFGYFNKKAFAGVNEFQARLVPFLKKDPQGLPICGRNTEQELARASHLLRR